jgi:hypothetical protein
MPICSIKVKVKLPLSLIKHHAMKTEAFLILALNGGERSASHAGRFTSGKQTAVPMGHEAVLASKPV